MSLEIVGQESNLLKTIRLPMRESLSTCDLCRCRIWNGKRIEQVKLGVKVPSLALKRLEMELHMHEVESRLEAWRDPIAAI